MPFGSLDATRKQYQRVDEACAAIERDGRAPLVYSFAQTIVCGRDDAEVSRRAKAIGREATAMGNGGLAGTPEHLAEQLREFAKAGAQRAYLQILDLSDLEHLDLLATEVAPLLAQ